MDMRYIDLHFPSFSGFFASFWCGSNVGRCRSKTNLSQKSKIFLRVSFSALPSFRGDSRWRSFPYLLYRENFYFFSRVRKVYICVSPTVTSQFFGLFCTFFVTVGDGRFWNGAKPTKIKEKACGRWRLTYNNNCRCFCFVWEKLLSSRRWKKKWCRSM